jgi:hypothetical protein
MLDLTNMKAALDHLVRTDFDAFKGLISRVAHDFREELHDAAMEAEAAVCFGHADYENAAEFADNPDFDDLREKQQVLDLFDALGDFV